MLCNSTCWHSVFIFIFSLLYFLRHMKNLNKNALVILVFTLPLALFAQPSEYVKDAKTKPIVPAEQKKVELPTQQTVQPSAKPVVEVATKSVPDPSVSSPISAPQPVIAPVEQAQTKGDAPIQVEEVEEIIPLMRFEKKTKNFGTVKMGEHPFHVFTYKNTGTEPVIIDIVSACDCTEVEYTTQPIPVGGTAYIKATYMSERAPENINKEFSKEITIVLKNKYADNGYPIVDTLKIKGNVVE
jgi:hypothetical protein